MYLYLKKFTLQSFQIRQFCLDFSELCYSSGMRLYVYIQSRMTSLVFVISLLLIFISPELIWVKNLISPLALGLQ